MSDSGAKNYIVWARKWRPKTFEEVIGQEHVTRTLINALEQNRLGHAFIFAGPRGVGKTSTARLLAKTVNGIGPEESSANLDVIEIDGASNRGIDEIRNLRENIRFAPVSSSHKIYIIDEVHMLSKEAFNALLKTLEEPPSHAIFIFATTEIHKVPLTILSRCQRFDFKRIPARLIADQLQKIASAESIEIDRDSLMLIARKSDGGMRDATSIMDQLASFSDGKVTLEKVQQSLGVINEELYFRFTRLLPQKDGGAVLHFAQDLFETGHDLLNFLQGLSEHVRNLLVVASTGDAGLLEAADHYRDQYLEDAKQFNEADLLQYLDLLATSESMLKFSENPRLVMELLLLKIAHKPKTPDIEELLKLVKNTPGAGASTQKKTEVSSDPPLQGQKSSNSPAFSPPSVAPASPAAPMEESLKPPTDSLLPPAPQIGTTSSSEGSAPMSLFGEPGPAPSQETTSPPPKFEEPKSSVPQPIAEPKLSPPPEFGQSTAVSSAEPKLAPPPQFGQTDTASPQVTPTREPVQVDTIAPPVQKEEPESEIPLPGLPPEAEQQKVAEEPPAPSEDSNFDQIKERWVEVVEEVRKEKVALGSFLQDGVPYKVENNQLHVAFDPKTAFHLEHVQKNATAVENALRTLFNTPLKLLCIQRSFQEEGLKKQIQSPEEILQNIKDKDEVLKKIIDTFDCEDIE